jgi:hypothetical protein
MAFTRLDVHDITDINFAPFMLGGNHAGTGGYDQHLVAVWVCHPVVQPWLKFTTLQL